MEILFLLMSFMSVISINPEYKRAVDCYVSVGYNIDYVGGQNRSNTGSSCVHWKLTTWAGSDFDGTMNNNFCRNPDKDIRGPWCMVRQNAKEFCTIPKCSSSAMFDGKGSITHTFNYNNSKADNISLSFHTNEEWQNDATIYSVVSWKAGFMEIRLTSNKKLNVKDIVQLQWKFSRNDPALKLHSRPNKANNGLVRVEILRNERQVIMKVNGEEYEGVISPTISKTAIFEIPGNIYIGNSPYGMNGFKGCVADASYNGIRTLDIAMGSREKDEYDTITILKGVWEGCLLVPPSDWVAPPTIESELSNDSEAELEYVVADKSDTTTSTSGAGFERTPSIVLFVSAFLFLRCIR